VTRLGQQRRSLGKRLVSAPVDYNGGGKNVAFFVRAVRGGL
jgi:hypothetical protein